MNWIKVSIWIIIPCLIYASKGSPVNDGEGLEKDQYFDENERKEHKLEYSIKINVVNVTNPEEFLEAGAGAGGLVKVGLNVTGPFVYDVKVSKTDVIRNPNGTLTFKTIKSYTFNADKSVEADDKTKFTVPNVPYLTLVTAGSTGIGENDDQLADFLLSASNAEPFVRKTVKELLWGYEDPLLKLLEEKGLVKTGRWGLFLDDVETTERSTLTVGSSFLKTDNEGQTRHNQDSYDTIHLINGQTRLTSWSNQNCGQINGTDFMDPHVRIPPSDANNSNPAPAYYLNSKFCRPFKFTLESNWAGGNRNQVLRYVVDNNIFDGNQDDRRNLCFCAHSDPDKCPLRGTMDLSGCKSDLSGIVVSWPYFNFADESISAKFGSEFQPRESTEEQAMQLDAASGKVEYLNLSVQWNVQMRRNIDIPQTLNFTDILIPIIQTTDNIQMVPTDQATWLWNEEGGNDNGNDNYAYQFLDESSGRQASEPLALESTKDVKKAVKVVKAVKALKKQKKRKSSAPNLNNSQHWVTVALIMTISKLYFRAL